MQENFFDDSELEAMPVQVLNDGKMDILSVKEASQYIRCSVAKIYDQAKRGVIPFVRNEGRILFRKIDLFNWLGTLQAGAVYNQKVGKYESPKLKMLEGAK